ncbi:hypothetical protein BS47DRAFT_1345708 [Hydnum rufescens UP504]|uniref:Uncharacterized protein n=1 Tax=Hydnum rufescens UP504 TaxID=1448309 RepID=A0A9P6AUM9_9AGAM|nr:hypothetical protein BS47DRAFT_1345708 [Hydnum rufescens UP504]
MSITLRNKSMTLEKRSIREDIHGAGQFKPSGAGILKLIRSDVCATHHTRNPRRVYSHEF